MELIFIRHGETEFNKHHQVMGQKVDAPLDEVGIAQAAEVISKLPEKVSIIYSSPLKRAAQTAQIISDHYKMPVNFSNLLMERDFGSLSGKTWHEINELTGKPLSEQDQALAYDYQEYGGESVGQVTDRLKNFLNQIKSEKNLENAIVVTHYGIIQIMNQLYPTTDHLKVKNTSVHKFQI